MTISKCLGTALLIDISSSATIALTIINSVFSDNGGSEASVCLNNQSEGNLDVNLQDFSILESKRNGLSVTGSNLNFEAARCAFKDNKENGITLGKKATIDSKEDCCSCCSQTVVVVDQAVAKQGRSTIKFVDSTIQMNQ